MIAFDDALEWLNQFDRTHISGPMLRSLVDQIASPRTSLDRLNELATQALQGARAHPDPLMTPEIMLLLAQAYASRGELQTAEKYTQDAVGIYQAQSDRHREATAMYLLGILQSKMTFKNTQAGANRLSSRDKFGTLSEERLFGATGRERDWYLDVLKRINIDQASQFDTAYGWLSRFDEQGTRLQPSSQALRDRIVEAVRTMNYPTARAIIDLLIETSTSSDDRLELPEALVVSAKAEFDMGNPDKARDLLLRAISIYPPRSHFQGVSRWMLGCVMWQTPGGHADGLKNWQQAVAIFQDLATRADKNNDQSQRNWYALRSAEMQAALNQRLSGNGF